MQNQSIKFVGRILDNVHGFIEYTEAEDKIIHLLLFKRLQSIKQLSLVNWVFPGSEHTRFIHSLGVMHIADKIAVKLDLSVDERKIVRLAGLLHDIGHYPLSHVCEFPYKKKMCQYSDQNFCKEINESVYETIKDFQIRTEVNFMEKSKPGHHEEIGALVIRTDPAIKAIVQDECGEQSLEVICDMITGNVERNNSDTSLLVQILHSELDADGIDYMLRDAVFSGTSFGSFEVDQLINSMTVSEYNNKKILCIQPNGIAAADQYLINKFFSYSQVVFNKHTAVLEWMAEQIVSWMQEKNMYFPLKKVLRETWIPALIQDAPKNKFIDFNDNFFWRSLRCMLENDAVRIFPKHIVKLSEMLLHHQELSFKEGEEYKIVSNKEELIKEELEKSYIFQQKGNINNMITIFSTKELTKHVPLKEYEEKIIASEAGKERREEEITDEERNIENEKKKAKRLMDGICVSAGSELHLLCDDHRSLMQQLSKTQLVVMRSYELVIDEDYDTTED